jgi:hypothetical protein
MASRNPYDDPFCKFDLSKFPEAYRQVEHDAFLHIMREVFDLALKLTPTYQVALEVSSEVLFRSTTDKVWDPAKGPLRNHMLGLVPISSRKLHGMHYGSRAEKRACAAFVHGQKGRVLS